MITLQNGQELSILNIPDQLTGTPNKNARHLIARRAFLKASLDDARIMRLFEDWVERSDIDQLRNYVRYRGEDEADMYLSDNLPPALRFGAGPGQWVQSSEAERYLLPPKPDWGAEGGGP